MVSAFVCDRPIKYLPMAFLFASTSSSVSSLSLFANSCSTLGPNKRSSFIFIELYINHRYSVRRRPTLVVQDLGQEIIIEYLLQILFALSLVQLLLLFFNTFAFNKAREQLICFGAPQDY